MGNREGDSMQYTPRMQVLLAEYNSLVLSSNLLPLPFLVSVTQEGKGEN